MSLQKASLVVSKISYSSSSNSTPASLLSPVLKGPKILLKPDRSHLYLHLISHMNMAGQNN